MLVKPAQKRSNAEFEAYPVYPGNDLGVTYSRERTVVKFWSPQAEAVTMRLYQTGHGDDLLETHSLVKKENGIWELILIGRFKNIYYTFQIQYEGDWLDEVPDIYAKAVGVNGKRGMIVDLPATNPDGWDETPQPEVQSFSDIILYELHVRDISIAANSGITNKGKFLGLAETNTQSPQGEKTGLAHIKDLGVTHLHILPIYDFLTIDESAPDKQQYNWGYDPQNYNAPEGWYATDPFNGKIRIKELKRMIQALHKEGIAVVMDVVYNHTGVTFESNFEQTIPGYFYRFAPNGQFSNASGCGNETASERPMVRKYIVDSVCYWAKEYKIDAFRFDLMGIHDIETMNAIRKALDKINPSIFMYGEGWTGGLSPYPDTKRALKHNTKQLDRIASFSDDFRDAIKGHWSSEQERGFASGQQGYEESIKFGVAGASYHPQINFDWVNYSKHPWSPNPAQTINFVACHDNHTLWDKLRLSVPNANEDQLIKMQKLALGIILTSQGIPFLHAGTEMARTKGLSHNSYNLPDEVNRIDWSRKSRYKGLYNYVKGLIALRKAHPAFRMPTTELIGEFLEFLPVHIPSFLSFMLHEHANGDSWKKIVVAYNGGWRGVTFKVPKGNWVIVGNKNRVDMRGIDEFSGFEVEIPAISILILVDAESFEANR